MEIHTRIHSSIQKSKVPYLFDLGFTSSSLLLLFLFLFFSLFLLLSLLRFFGSQNETKFGLKSHFKLRPCLVFAFLILFPIFAFRSLGSSLFANQLMPYSNLAPNLSSNSIITYNLIDLCLSYPQVVND